MGTAAHYAVMQALEAVAQRAKSTIASLLNLFLIRAGIVRYQQTLICLDPMQQLAVWSASFGRHIIAYRKYTKTWLLSNEPRLDCRRDMLVQ
jgi:hypothetical protein